MINTRPFKRRQAPIRGAFARQYRKDSAAFVGGTQTARGQIIDYSGGVAKNFKTFVLHCYPF